MVACSLAFATSRSQRLAARFPRVDTRQAELGFTDLKRIAINGVRLSLKQKGIHAFGECGRSHNAKNRKRQGKAGPQCHLIRTPDPAHNESQYRPQQLPGAYWPGDRDAFVRHRATRNHRV